MSNLQTSCPGPQARAREGFAPTFIDEPLLVAAHPDDETIGAGATLSYLPGCVVLHLTSGAPRDRRFFPEGFTGSSDEYEQLRRAELAGALALAEIRPDRVWTLGAVDQEVALEIEPLTAALVAVIIALRPPVILTHPYEGGHPDHDAAALIVHAAVELARRRANLDPLIVEMTSYHAGAGGLVTGAFLGGGGGGGAVFTFSLSTRDRRRKEQMLACFRSQRRTLALFEAAAVERFRVAPRYDFTRPPHPGPLFYEQLGFSMSGERFRKLAAEALRRLELNHTPCL